MGEVYSTRLEWKGSKEIGERLSLLVPEKFHHELLNTEGESRLSIDINADSLEELREIVDRLLTLFSDQDQ